MNLLNNDLKNAKNILDSGEYTCVLCKDDDIVLGKEKGVRPLVELIEDEKEYNGFSAADKIVGKAAAHLYILLKVSSVYAVVMSMEAEKLLSQHNIETSYDILTDSIINRKGNDICPMEKAVKGIEDSQTAFCKIKETIELLRSRQ